MARRWYVLKTRQEQRAREDLADQGFLSYVPMERVSRRLGRKVRPVERPVWRGYVFVICEPEDFDAILARESAQEIVRWPVDVLTASGPIVVLQPISLALSALDPIMAAEWDGELDYAGRQTFSPQLGDVVTVKSGKWKGFLGRIVALSKRKMTLDGERGSIGRLQVEPDHLSQAPDEEDEEQHLAA